MKVDKQTRRLERESSQIRGRIRQLNLPLQGGNAIAPTQRGRPDSDSQDLFAWGSRQKKFKQAGSISLRGALSHTSSPARHGRTRGGRLGQYLYSGSFGQLTPMRQGDNVHRNRVFFVMLVLSLVAYVIYHITVD